MSPPSPASLGLRFCALICAAASLLTAENAFAQNLVSNGDFEIGPYFTRGTITNWIVSGSGQIAENSGEGYTSGTHVAAFGEGGNSQGNILSQTISTIPGQAYIFEFDGGVYGIPDGAMQVRAQVLGNTSRFDETLAPPVINSPDPNQTEFHHYFRMFTADSTSTTIRFT